METFCFEPAETTYETKLCVLPGVTASCVQLASCGALLTASSSVFPLAVIVRRFRDMPLSAKYRYRHSLPLASSAVHAAIGVALRALSVSLRVISEARTVGSVADTHIHSLGDDKCPVRQDTRVQVPVSEGTKCGVYAPLPESMSTILIKPFWKKRHRLPSPQQVATR